MSSNTPHNTSTTTDSSCLRRSRHFTFIITTLFLTLTANSASAINKCVDSGGNVTYQESACPENDNQQDIKLRQQPSTVKSASKEHGPTANDSSEDATILELVSVQTTYELCTKVSPAFAEKNAPLLKEWNAQNSAKLARFEKSERYKLLLENGRSQSAQHMQMPGIGTQLAKFCEVQFLPALRNNIHQ